MRSGGIFCRAFINLRKAGQFMKRIKEKITVIIKDSERRKQLVIILGIIAAAAAAIVLAVKLYRRYKEDFIVEDFEEDFDDFDDIFEDESQG